MTNSFIMIGVQSMDASVDFFKNILDFQVEGNQKPNNDIELTFLKNADNFMIELVYRTDIPVPDNKDSSTSIMFRHIDLEAKKEVLVNNDIKYISAALPNGTKFLKFQDPNNVNIVLYE